MRMSSFASENGAGLRGHVLFLGERGGLGVAGYQLGEHEGNGHGKGRERVKTATDRSSLSPQSMNKVSLVQPRTRS